MKKFIALLLSTIMCFAVVACESEENLSSSSEISSSKIEPTQKNPTSEELTTDNFNSHFAVKIQITDYHETIKNKHYYDCSCYITVEIDKRTDIELLDDIPVELKIFTNGWSVPDVERSGIWDSTEKKSYSRIEIKLPKSGYVFETFPCTYFGYSSKSGDLPEAKIGYVNTKIIYT